VDQLLYRLGHDLRLPQNHGESSVSWIPRPNARRSLEQFRIDAASVSFMLQL
jgi:hypothetical protein